MHNLRKLYSPNLILIVFLEVQREAESPSAPLGYLDRNDNALTDDLILTLNKRLRKSLMMFDSGKRVI